MKSIQKHWTLFSLVVLLAAGGWIAMTALTQQTTTQGQIPAPRPGFLAPDFNLQTLEGDTIQLSQQRGSPVIVNIWASWCPPCRAEMPAIQSVYDEYQSDGLQVLAVNSTVQDSYNAAEAFAGEYGLTFPVLMDTDGTVTDQYEVSALPTTYFIDANGIIQKVVVGGPMTEAMLKSEVTKLMEAR